MKRPLLGAAALATAGALTTLTFAPAFATHTVAQADATALRLSIAGSPSDSGTVTATHDGTTETKTGDPNPAIGVLGNQDLIDTGVLLQDAHAGIDGQDGVSAACAGLTGQGGAIVQIGEPNCITPGDAVGVNIANLDLTGTVLIDPDSAIAELGALQPLIDDVLGPVTSELAGALDPIADLGIGGTLGAVDAFCKAVPGSATGGAHLVNSRLELTIPDQEPIVLADLSNPEFPKPNTKVVSELDQLAEHLLMLVENNLKMSLNEALAPLGEAVANDIRPVLVKEVLAQIAPQLQPLEAGLLDITLNKQSTNGPGHIEVTALDLKLAPGAEDFAGSPLVDLQIGNVNCGPNSRIHPPLSPEEPGTPEDPAEPAVPTVVNSGLEGGAATPADEQAGKALVAGGLLALAGAAGALGYRRFAAK